MPRPNIFASPTRTTSIFVPGILPFLAPRAFAPWPERLVRRQLRLERRIPREREPPEASQALEEASAEESDRLAAALGESGFDDSTYDSKQWQSLTPAWKDQSTTDVLQSGEGDAKSHVRRVANRGSTVTEPKSYSAIRERTDEPGIGSWQLEEQFEQNYNDIWGVEESEEFEQRGTERFIPRSTPPDSDQARSGEERQKERKLLAAQDPSWPPVLPESGYFTRRVLLNRPLQSGSYYTKILRPNSKFQKPSQRVREAPKVTSESRSDVDYILFDQIQKLEGPQLVEKYNEVETSSLAIHRYTRMQFCHYLARKGETETATRALKALYETGESFRKPRIRKLCATLLQNGYRNKNSVDTDSTPTDVELFEWMVTCGLHPNRVIYNILIYNALERNDRKTAYEIYQVMKGKKKVRNKPDSYTFSMLINSAKAHGEMELVQEIFHVATKAGRLDKYILADLLHAVYLFHAYRIRVLSQIDRRKTSPLEAMFGLFRRYFFTQPFLDFIPPHQMPSQVIDVLPTDVLPEESSSKHQLTEPDNAVLFLMLAGVIKYIHEPGVVLDYYRQFRKLVQENHPSARNLAAHHAIYEIFLQAFGRWEDTLPVCAEVLQDMMSQKVLESKGSKSPSGPEDSQKLPDSKELEDSQQPKDSENPLPAANRFLQPTVKTWSILIKAFMKHAQPRAAEKIMKMMQDRGTTPTDVTWHHLIGGYAGLQDVRGALNAMDRMIAQGFPANEMTDWKLHYIKDKDALNRMKAAREQPEKGSFSNEYGDEYEWDVNQEEVGGNENPDEDEPNDNQRDYESNQNQEVHESNEDWEE